MAKQVAGKEPKEKRTDKRARKQANAQAQQTAMKFILPGTALVFMAIFALIFYLSLGELPVSEEADMETPSEVEIE
ncbi:hypothetical protein CYMTET_6704 [Cymbomonas tetramitiformis]|uniref:Uncharacterized protein n=1 Tax=Cymbomonas tetramitiformis TaxID=36881 RepID=A0AAE0GWW9_9CHLO|nr:hypothetical protein CYMTET_6704 [Cymbomonas tetramitiformis]